MVAAGAAQPNDMPDIGHLRLGFREQQRAQTYPAVGTAQRFAVSAG